MENGADANKKNKQGMTPLYIAASGGQLPCIILLIEKGAIVDAADKKGVTPLYAASNQDVDSEILEYLLSKGAKVTILNRHDRVFQIGK